MSVNAVNKPMSAAEVAEYLGIGKSTVYQLPIVYYSYGGRRVYDLKDVLDYKASCRRVPHKVSMPTLKLTLSSVNADTALTEYFKKRGLMDSEGNKIRKRRSKTKC